MKQLSNKIIFVFLLAVGLSLVPAYKADAMYELLRFIEEGDLGGGSGGSSGTTTTPPVVPIPNISLTYNIDKISVTYSPKENIVVTIGAKNNLCSNAVLGVNISGYIKSQGSATSKNIIDNTSIQGSYSLESNEIYTAPDNEGEDAFVGTLSVYKATSSYIKMEYAPLNDPSGLTTEYLSVGSVFIVDDSSYRFEGDHFVYTNSGLTVPLDYLFHNTSPDGKKYFNYSEGGINYLYTYYPATITNELASTPYTFEIPFTVVAPTPKSITVEVYKNNVKVPQGADKVISQAVQSGTELLIKYTPSGLSFPFNCDEPVSREHPNGYTRTFTSQIDITNNNPGFSVIPSKTTNYSVTCSN